ncbi:MAG: hypothetical protein NC088_01175 [Bacteroides sp.]|nr:hypothetical protein [Clostridium sp.]MCM1458728.1 hypothetical protein [Bacteroides sp.]
MTHIFSHYYADNDIYSARLVPLPNPKFVVFYNGVTRQPERKEFRLSDAYTHREENPSLELVVLQLNINPGYNDELMKACPTLREYMLFVDMIRKYSRTTDISTAVTNAVDDCIRENILSEFLRKNKREVIAMSIFEYDAELHEKTLKEIGYEEGHADGYGQGRSEGIMATISLLKENGFSNDKITEALISKFALSPEDAQKYLTQTDK